MSKAVFDALNRDLRHLQSLATAVDREINNFEKLSRFYASCSLKLLDDRALNEFFKNFFRLYLYVIDDVTVLFTGSLCRQYHKLRHMNLYKGSDNGSLSALHSRGKEGAYFSSIDLSRCSVDGFNFEFRKAERHQGMEKYEDVSIVLFFHAHRTINLFMCIALVNDRNGGLCRRNFRPSAKRNEVSAIKLCEHCQPTTE